LNTKLYANELLIKLVTEKELAILETIWNSELTPEQKIKNLIEEKKSV
jgi:hypothetical protein